MNVLQSGVRIAEAPEAEASQYRAARMRLSEGVHWPASKRVLAVLILTGLFLVAELLLPLGTAIRIGPDEDYEMAKATLCLKGHRLYAEVWNDQPPLHTFVVTQVIRHITASILGPRLITVAAAAMLINAVFLLGLRLNGGWVGSLATTLLIGSPGFLELSSSCMVEIPALAPAVAALCVLLVARRSTWPSAEVIAGALFGVSLQVKYINAVLLPVAAFAVWLRVEPPLAWKREYVVRCVAMGVTLAASFLMLNWLADGGSLALQFRQSWAAHFAGTRSFEYGSPADRPFDWGTLVRNWDTTVPAAAALGLTVARWWRAQAVWSLGKRSFRGWSSNKSGIENPPHSNLSPPGEGKRLAPWQRRGTVPGGAPYQGLRPLATWFPFLWLGLSLVVFGTHKPWWPCYYVHNAVPLCWCAGIGIDALRRRVWAAKSWRATMAFALAVAGIAAWVGARVYLEVTAIRSLPELDSSLVLKEIERVRPFAGWLYTDEPIYSFHADIPMPPQLAVAALKRFWSGDMTNARLSAELWSLKPGVILVGNYPRPVPYQDLLGAHYRLVFMDNTHRLYVRSDVAKKANM